jgi:hypothetical protein
MDQFLKSLRHRRLIIQSRIEDEEARPSPDGLRLRALRKLKLQLRDQIEFIDRMNRYGQAVAIPVVRRRSSRFLLPEKA